jgi:hypothetical protein
VLLDHAEPDEVGRRANRRSEPAHGRRECGKQHEARAVGKLPVVDLDSIARGLAPRHLGEDCQRHRKHHGGGGAVGYPYGNKSTSATKGSHQPHGAAADPVNAQHAKGDAPVEAMVQHRSGQEKASEE